MFNLTIYNQICNPAQKLLTSYIPEVPKDTVKGLIRSFGYPFAVSSLLSGGNLLAGLSGGALGIFAHLVHATIMTIFNKIKFYDPQHSQHHTSNRPLHSIFLISWGSALYLGRGLGIAINVKASFFASLPFYIWNTFKLESPLIGIAVV